MVCHHLTFLSQHLNRSHHPYLLGQFSGGSQHQSLGLLLINLQLLQDGDGECGRLAST